MYRTTELSELMAGMMFTWGDIIKFHEIGPYVILEYHPWESSGCRVCTGSPSEEISFHAWIDGRDSSRSIENLEAAIVGAIAYKFDGPNSQAGSFFMKMIAQYVTSGARPDHGELPPRV